MDIYKRIYELENEIAALPQGSINMKKIYGKEAALSAMDREWKKQKQVH